MMIGRVCLTCAFVNVGVGYGRRAAVFAVCARRERGRD